jgi:hypothetical protein
MTASAKLRESQGRQLDRYLEVLAGQHPAGNLLDIRYVLANGEMGRVFVPARRRDQAARAIHSLAFRSDVYCGVLLRSRRAGGRDAVTNSHLAFTEIDHPDALERLARFDRPPSMIVNSGTTGHAHAYFLLRAPATPTEVEQANRRLAHRLGGDPASVDAARILRPAGTLSHKHTPPTAVELIALNTTRRYELDELLDGLPPAPPQPVTGRGRAKPPRTRLDEQLLAIPAATYVRELTGLKPRRDGKINCPFHHPDENPSLQLYNDGTFYCYGCATGGSIYDFAAALWLTGQSSGEKLRGRRFIEVRSRLASIFLGDESEQGHSERVIGGGSRGRPGLRDEARRSAER